MVRILTRLQSLQVVAMCVFLTPIVSAADGSSGNDLNDPREIFTLPWLQEMGGLAERMKPVGGSNRRLVLRNETGHALCFQEFEVRSQMIRKDQPQYLEPAPIALLTKNGKQLPKSWVDGDPITLAMYYVLGAGRELEFDLQPLKKEALDLFIIDEAGTYLLVYALYGAECRKFEVRRPIVGVEYLFNKLISLWREHKSHPEHESSSVVRPLEPTQEFGGVLFWYAEPVDITQIDVDRMKLVRGF